MTDAHQDEYDDNLVEVLEIIWGRGFMAPGGADVVRQIVGDLALQDRLVLDIGCGIGGGDFVMAGEYGAQVIGLDLEAPLLARARREAAAAGLDGRIEFRQVEPGPIPLDAASVDVVYSSGAFTQIADKLGMFKEVHRVLRPGGWFTAYDWMRGPEPYSPDMLTWFELEGLTYAMETLETHAELLAKAGFTDLSTRDDGGWYQRECHAELARMQGPLGPILIERLGRETYDHYLENWRAMAVVLDGGELRPGFYRGRKPLGA